MVVCVCVFCTVIQSLSPTRTCALFTTFSSVNHSKSLSSSHSQVSQNYLLLCRQLVCRDLQLLGLDRNHNDNFCGTQLLQGLNNRHVLSLPSTCKPQSSLHVQHCAITMVMSSFFITRHFVTSGYCSSTTQLTTEETVTSNQTLRSQISALNCP